MTELKHVWCATDGDGEILFSFVYINPRSFVRHDKISSNVFASSGYKMRPVVVVSYEKLKQKFSQEEILDLARCPDGSDDVLVGDIGDQND